jgi:hypothetical protein
MSKINLEEDVDRSVRVDVDRSVRVKNLARGGGDFFIVHNDKRSELWKSQASLDSIMASTPACGAGSRSSILRLDNHFCAVRKQSGLAPLPYA